MEPVAALPPQHGNRALVDAQRTVRNHQVGIKLHLISKSVTLRACPEKEYHFDLDTPFGEYPQKIQDILLHGTGGKEVLVYYEGQRGKGQYPIAFEGLIRNVERRYRETGSDATKQEYETFMRITPCRLCKGQRLKKEALAVTVCGKNIYEITSMFIGELSQFLQNMKLTEQQEADRQPDFKGNPGKSWLPD